MTPFDADALVAMLRTFYPIVSSGYLQRARGERPSYFAGGVLIGSSRTHLQLPDGRIFDLVFDEGSPRAAWQALDVTHDGPGVDDPLALEDGPLAPIDPIDVERPRSDGTFQGLGAQLHADLLGLEDEARVANQDVSAVSDPTPFADATADDLGRAATALGDQATTLEALTPGEEIDKSIGASASADAAVTDWDGLTPPHLPTLPAPPPPGDEPPKELHPLPPDF